MVDPALPGRGAAVAKSGNGWGRGVTSWFTDSKSPTRDRQCLKYVRVLVLRSDSDRLPCEEIVGGPLRNVGPCVRLWVTGPCHQLQPLLDHYGTTRMVSRAFADLTSPSGARRHRNRVQQRGYRRSIEPLRDSTFSNAQTRCGPNHWKPEALSIRDHVFRLVKAVLAPDVSVLFPDLPYRLLHLRDSSFRDQWSLPARHYPDGGTLSLLSSSTTLQHATVQK